MIRYKIVCKDKLTSAFINFPKYKLIYKPNTIVCKAPETIGIFVYKTLKDAKCPFEKSNSMQINDRSHKIIRVKPLSKGRTLLFAPMDFNFHTIRNLYRYQKELFVNKNYSDEQRRRIEILLKHTYQYNSGTMVYDAVKVLE